ncbi:hypothetical protein JVT61DRAFT_4125 [Boletus reticuloceps]|uniref:Uncharacterized protein n=1 Tax=Boletus reticuloceps TaxID=495285 RepID=A0A8I2YLJ7_9AGAM|nr:hypothetical protein JVT61DRAFT_4125 [Boletus reticuloceps]
MYTSAHLPRPPGPFPWQSTDFLRRTLVQSARLARHWTSQPIRFLSRHSLPLRHGDDCRWVCGRWLILRKSTKQLVSHNVDTGVEQTLYQWGDQCISWSATCLTSYRGGLLYVVLCIGNGHTIDGVHVSDYSMHSSSLTCFTCRKLLEFRVDDDSRNLSGPISSDVPISLPVGDISPRVESSDAPFLFISVDPSLRHAENALIFDIRTQIFYEFPKFEYPVRLGQVP